MFHKVLRQMPALKTFTTCKTCASNILQPRWHPTSLRTCNFFFKYVPPNDRVLPDKNASAPASKTQATLKKGPKLIKPNGKKVPALHRYNRSRGGVKIDSTSTYLGGNTHHRPKAQILSYIQHVSRKKNTTYVHSSSHELSFPQSPKECALLFVQPLAHGAQILQHPAYRPRRFLRSIKRCHPAVGCTA